MAETNKEFCTQNKNLFEDVINKFEKDKYKNTNRNELYTILNYEKIINSMIDMISGCKKYQEAGSNSYSNDKVLEATRNLYNSMMTDKKFRRDYILSDFLDILKSFLKTSTDLEKVFDENKEATGQLKQIILMTKNQMIRIRKVFKDDCKINAWLVTKDTAHAKSLESRLMSDYNNSKTPVIHQKKFK